MVKHLGDRARRARLHRAEHPHLGRPTRTPAPAASPTSRRYNTAAPSTQTIDRPGERSSSFFDPQPADPQLYTFLLAQIAQAIERADDDLAPAAAGWGYERDRRAHAATAASRPTSPTTGSCTATARAPRTRTPRAPIHTIDPDVNVLRVDQVDARRPARPDRRVVDLRQPRDRHQGLVPVLQRRPPRLGDARLRAARPRAPAKVPRRPGGRQRLRQLQRGRHVGRPRPPRARGARTTSAASRRRRCSAPGAGRALVARGPRSTCAGRASASAARTTEDGPVADRSRGRPAVPDRLRGGARPALRRHRRALRGHAQRRRATGPQGNKIGDPCGRGAQRACRCWRCASAPRAIVSVPGEGTKEVGARIRAAVPGRGRRLAGSTASSSSGLANEFILYFTTPEEYDRQHYEGGNTHFGRSSSTSCRTELRQAGGHARPRRARAARPPSSTPTNGVSPDGPAVPGGRRRAARSSSSPATSRASSSAAHRAGRAARRASTARSTRAFVTAERRVQGAGWRADDDLGLAMLWKVDDDGVHDAQWEVPRDGPGRHVPPGRHREALPAGVGRVRRAARRARCTRRGRARRPGGRASRCATRRRCATSTSPTARRPRASPRCGSASAGAPCGCAAAGGGRCPCGCRPACRCASRPAPCATSTATAARTPSSCRAERLLGRLVGERALEQLQRA